MTQPLILIIEDEASLQRFLGPTLVNQGYRVIQAANAAEAITMARSYNPDLILLDLGLPDQDGMKVLNQIREWSHRPILIISARSQERDKVRALDQGADDYLTKPFGAPELLARIRVALRHAVQDVGAGEVFEYEGLRVDLTHRDVSVQGDPVRLTALEYRLLESLVRRAGKVATHSQLLTEVWGPACEGQTHYLRIYMAQLRKKLEPDPTRPRFFLTEPGVGYRLNTE